MSPMNDHISAEDARNALEWLVAMGVDEAIEDSPQDRLTQKTDNQTQTPQPQKAAEPHPSGPTVVKPKAPQIPGGELTMRARDVAAKAESLADLEQALKAFDAGHISRAAKQTVFAVGPVDAPIMMIGEAPGADEDRTGIPFVGRSGQLLDRILEATGLSREKNVRITNVVPWRPLGNKTPDLATVSLCLPFLIRQIELCNPRFIISLGATPARALLNVDTGITRLRGRWQDCTAGSWSGQLLPTYHPSYLLRRPHFKGDVWRDMLTLKEKMSRDMS